jgi:hypothetical protein
LRFGAGEPVFLRFSALAGRFSVFERLAMDLILDGLSAVGAREERNSSTIAEGDDDQSIVSISI